jgi:demethylmenaquinone methyltransferase/2-methoxy-6-polyprenyl-1,4-benzoquinol methylase
MNKAKKGKKEEVRMMFNSIAHRYDFLNHFLSLGIDHSWRKRLVKQLRKQNAARILDVATGTADLAIAAAKIPGTHVTGIDISEEMLEIGRKKIIEKGLEKRISILKGDSENIEFPDGEFDAVMVAFGVRNFENLSKGISEFYRILKPGGIAYILEFSQAKGMVFKPLFKFYFLRILPLLGRMISKDIGAYTYLPESVEKFPSGDDFLNIMKKEGFTDTLYLSLTFGVASIYLGYK